MPWLQDLTGLKNESYESIHENMLLDGDRLRSKINGRSFLYGKLETPSLADLRQRCSLLKPVAGAIRISQKVGDVQKFHIDPENAGALFQVASQFNLLEMVSPGVTPEEGIGRYEYDRTQGPACAIAAGAGTIYRNYFAEVNGKIGQTADNQIDCIADLGTKLGNSEESLWKMRNGYLLPTEQGLQRVDHLLRSLDEEGFDQLGGLLKIGIQWNTEVTIMENGHTVSQVYGSAAPIAYSGLKSSLWQNFARLILEASYEATFCAAVLNAHQTGQNKLFLTLLGGGVFGNDIEMILSAIHRSMTIFKNHALDVAIISYGRPCSRIQTFVDSF